MGCCQRSLGGARGRLLGAALIVIIAPSLAEAAPIQLTKAQFDLLSGASVIEDFESFAVGPTPSPLTLVNGIFTAPEPSIEPSGPPTIQICLGTANNCLKPLDLGTAPAEFDPPEFTSFPPGTTAWSTDIGLFESDDIFNITAVGGSVTLSLSIFSFPFTVIAGRAPPLELAFLSFIGFRDDLGLSSVSFKNVTDTALQSAGNYAFDNVTTVIAAAPEPPSVVLFAVGCLFVLAGVRFKRSRSARP